MSLEWIGVKKKRWREKPHRRGQAPGGVWWMGVCRRCLCESEENEDRSPKGANMAGAIFVGILDFERGR